MLSWVLVKQARHEHMSDEYKRPIYGCSVAEAPILVYQPNTRPPQLVPSELANMGKVKRTNNDLPNTYSRSTTETIMHPVGQNILLIHPHFGIAFNTHCILYVDSLDVGCHSFQLFKER